MYLLVFLSITLNSDSLQSQIVYDSLHPLLDHERLLFHYDEWRVKNSCSCLGLPWTIPVSLESTVRVRVTLWLAVCRQSVRLGDTQTTRIVIFQLNTCGYSPYIISSLTRVWVCRLQLLLVLARAIILRSESRGTNERMNTFYSLRFETPPTCTAGTGWPGCTPRHWVPFSSPPTTRRATVKVFDPASTRDSRKHTNSLLTS
jgi:hypothetical protein